MGTPSVHEADSTDCEAGFMERVLVLATRRIPESIRMQEVNCAEMRAAVFALGDAPTAC